MLEKYFAEMLKSWVSCVWWRNGWKEGLGREIAFRCSMRAISILFNWSLVFPKPSLFRESGEFLRST